MTLLGEKRAIFSDQPAITRGFNLWLAVFLFWAPPFLATAAPSLTARLDRDVVTLGEIVTLSLVFEEAVPKGTPTLPNLPGLTVKDMSQSREFNILNGQTTSKFSYQYTLVPTQVGEFTLPAMQINVDGKNLVTQPLKLKVVKGEAPAEGGVTNLAFLKVLVPKTEVYLGEPFPVEIQLYWQNAQDIQMPQLKADGFSLGQNAKPQQRQTQIGNLVYHLAIFRTSATAARSGSLQLAAECNLTLLVPDSSPRRRDPFDSFNIFGPRMQARPATLQSTSQFITVRSLPTQNVPENFRGAVGQFTLGVTAGPTNLSVGDPITVKIQIAGSGRLNGLTIPDQPQWREFKIYPPNAKVDSNDPLGLSGMKTFEQVVVPENHEIQSLPPFQFSFFDPATKGYSLLSGPAIPLHIRPSASPTPPPNLTNATASAEATPPLNEIVRIKAQFAAVGGGNVPLIQRPWFLGLQAVPVLTWLSLWVARKRSESLASNPKLRRQRQVAQRVREGVRELRKLAAAQKSDDFFVLLFRLLQEQLGERLNLPASAITEAVIDERFREGDLASGAIATMHALFQACNQARYAPLQSSQELDSFIPRLEEVLRELQNLKS